jgi:hypothetical protein
LDERVTMPHKKRALWRGEKAKKRVYKILFLNTSPQVFEAESKIHAKALAESYPGNRGFYVSNVVEMVEKK